MRPPGGSSSGPVTSASVTRSWPRPTESILADHRARSESYLAFQASGGMSRGRLVVMKPTTSASSSYCSSEVTKPKERTHRATASAAVRPWDVSRYRGLEKR